MLNLFLSHFHFNHFLFYLFYFFNSFSFSWLFFCFSSMPLIKFQLNPFPLRHLGILNSFLRWFLSYSSIFFLGSINSSHFFLGFFACDFVGFWGIFCLFVFKFMILVGFSYLQMLVWGYFIQFRELYQPFPTVMWLLSFEGRAFICWDILSLTLCFLLMVAFHKFRRLSSIVTLALGWFIRFLFQEPPLLLA